MDQALQKALQITEMNKTVSALPAGAVIVDDGDDDGGGGGGDDSPVLKGFQDLGAPLWVLQMHAWTRGDVGEADEDLGRRSCQVRVELIPNIGARASWR